MAAASTPAAAGSGFNATLAALVCALGTQVQSLRSELRSTQQQLLMRDARARHAAAAGHHSAPLGGFPFAHPRAPAADVAPGEPRFAPPDRADGSYSSYESLGGAAAVQTSSSLTSLEADAVAILTELGPADVDGDQRHLGALLAPSAGEVAALLEDASGRARQTILAVGELRAAWAASRRAMFSIPAPVSAEARLCVPADTSRLGPPAVAHWAATGGEDVAGAGYVTLGEGRWALECAVANRCLRARLAQAEAQLAAERCLPAEVVDDA